MEALKFESSLFASNCVIKYNYLLTAVNTPVDQIASCTLGDLRLMNGTSDLEGRVEVCFGNLWGTICHNSWDNRDAGVICKQLFNSSFGKIKCITHDISSNSFYINLFCMSGGHALNGSRFGSGDIPIVLQHINCKGNETLLANCSTISSTTSPCNDSTVAGVVCYGKILIWILSVLQHTLDLNVWFHSIS